MKRLLFVLIASLGLFLIYPPCAYAQMSKKEQKELKKAIKDAQKNVRNARSFYERDDASQGDKAQGKRIIDAAIKDPLLIDWDQTWSTAALIYRENFYAETINFNTGARTDTVAMYDYLVKWYEYTIIADSIQRNPSDPKVKPSNEARNKHAESINSTLSMLVNGGIFFFNNRADFNKSYELFDMFYVMAEADIIKDYVSQRPEFEEDKIKFAYFPALAAYRLENWENVLKYGELAMKDIGLAEDDHNGELATEIVCEAYGNLGDTVNWLKTLKEGLRLYPTVDYYYNKLLNYYNDKNNMDELKVFVSEMVEQDPEKAYNYYVLGYIHQKAGEYTQAQDYYKTAIEKDATLTDAYNNLGLSYLEEAEVFWNANDNVDIRSREYQQLMEKEKVYYQTALPVFEKLREMLPGDSDKWALPLYRIYYKLNMSKELNAIEKLLDLGD